MSKSRTGSLTLGFISKWPYDPEISAQMFGRGKSQMLFHHRNVNDTRRIFLRDRSDHPKA
jgi:hypothetical protein